MNTEELINQTKRLLKKAGDPKTIDGVWVETCEFLRVYAGVNSDFYQTIKAAPVSRLGTVDAAAKTYQVLKSYLEYVEAGLRSEISPERRAQLDVVSDFLEMATVLLNSKSVHPAAPAVLIGATLEEFLRTWVESDSLSLAGRKLGLETYSQVLRDANLITKQDGKDITSWAGIRNHAAHGEWDEVSDRNRIFLMLEGINLFMRKYS
jgi:hypothetical protein